MTDDNLFDEIESRIEANGHVPVTGDILRLILEQEDAEAAVLAALGNEAYVVSLASVAVGEFELLCAELEKRTKVKVVKRLEKTVNDRRSELRREERNRPPQEEKPLTAEEIIAKLASEVDSATANVLNLIALLDDIVNFLLRFVWFVHSEQVHACALWVMHTYLIPAADTSPRLSVRAPMKACGKTRLLEAMEQLVFRGHLWVSPTSAVVFRTLGAGPATLLLDEIDTIYGPRAKGDEDLRAVIDAGQRRGATVPRCVGDDNKVVPFPCFGPIALGGIGHLPGTIEDRAIIISLAKKRRSDTVERFRPTKDVVTKPAADIRARAIAWTNEHLIDVATAIPELPSFLTDRQQDGWEPLLAIAETAGGHWPATARRAAKKLSKRRVGGSDEVAIPLLEDVRAIFAAKNDPEFLSCTEITTGLNEMMDDPWPSWHGSRGIQPHDLSRMLRDFYIHPRQTKKDKQTRRCFWRSDLEPVWERYLGEVDLTDSEEVCAQESPSLGGSRHMWRYPPSPEDPRVHMSLFDLTEGEEEE